MGASIAQRLMSVGHEVGVWNRSAAKMKPLTDAGARLFASPAELVDGCESAIVMLLKNYVSAYIERWNMLLGFVFLFIVLVMPTGIVPGLQKLSARLRGRSS